MQFRVAAIFFLVQLWTALAYPTLMSSCTNIPAAGGSLPNGGNKAMGITSVLDGKSQCKIQGLPKDGVDPCKTYKFTVTSQEPLSQLVSLSSGTLNGKGKALTKQCQAVNNKLTAAEYTWTVPNTPEAKHTVSALCGKMGKVYAATKLTVKASNKACAAENIDGGCIIPRPDQTNNPEFDYFMLVLQWPPGVAEMPGMVNGAKCFDYPTIHGLWPSREYKAETYPHDCSTQAFAPRTLPSNLLAKMTFYWPTFKQGGTNEEFWSHEWEKHGTCAAFEQQQDYFEKTVHAHGLVLKQIQRALLHDFTPSHSIAYPLAAVVDKLGGNVVLSCANGGVLAEITYCLDSRTLAPRQCPKSVCHYKCGDAVKILPKECTNSGEKEEGQAMGAILIVLIMVAAVVGYFVKQRRMMALQRGENVVYVELQ